MLKQNVLQFGFDKNWFRGFFHQNFIELLNIITDNMPKYWHIHNDHGEREIRAGASQYTKYNQVQMENGYAYVSDMGIFIDARQKSHNQWNNFIIIYISVDRINEIDSHRERVRRCSQFEEILSEYNMTI